MIDHHFYCRYDEVDGVYFRLYTVSTPIKILYGGECVLIFSEDILKIDNFVINTEENYGFCIGADGVVSKSQFSGEEGISITQYRNLNLLDTYPFNSYTSEIVILENVNLNCLQCIFVKQHLINENIIQHIKSRHIQLYAL